MTPVQIPAARQPVTEKGPAGEPLFTRTWYLFMQQVFQRVANSGAAAAAVTVGASPFTYAAAADGILLISGGTVTLIEYGRGGVFTDTGVIAGAVPLFNGDSVRVTHAGAPTMTFIRR
jgi:hypothetical protein